MSGPQTSVLGTPLSSLGSMVLGTIVPPNPGPNPLVRSPATNWSTTFTPPIPAGQVAGQIESFELAQLDQQLSGAINGDDGSTHAPPYPIQLGTNMAGAMDGLQWLLPMTATSGPPNNGGPCPATFSQTVTLIGGPSVTYQVALRFRGVVEQKTYTGSSAGGASGLNSSFFVSGGTPAADVWNVYSLTVSSPSATYYLNSGTSGIRSCNVIDYTATIPINGGATVTLTANSIDSSEIFPSSDTSGVNWLSVPGVTSPPQPYFGQMIQVNVIGGLPLSTGGAGVIVTGPTVVSRGGTLQAHSGVSGTPATATIQCAVQTPIVRGGVTVGIDGDFPKFGPGNPFATHRVLQPCFDFRGVPNSVWHTRREDGGLQAFSPQLDLSDGLGMRTAFGYMRLRPHDRSTLTEVQLCFRVPTKHTQLPANMPSAAVLRFDQYGNYAGSLTSQAAGADAFGLVQVPKPSSALAWNNYGATQILTITCDHNNVIDLSQYTYKLQINEESGGLNGYPWQLTWKPAVRATGPAPTGGMIGAGPIDGVSLNDGDRVLINHALYSGASGTHGFSMFDGIWIANSVGYWTRAPDLQSAANFSQGFVVPVLQGTVRAGSFWQSQSSVGSWIPYYMSSSVNQWSNNNSSILKATYVYPTVPNGFWYAPTTLGSLFAGLFYAEPAIWPKSAGESVDVTASSSTSRWAPSTPYTGTTSFVVPTVPNGLFYQCHTAGANNSGSTEPTWPTVFGGTVADGSTSWLCAGQVATFICEGPTPQPLTMLQAPDKSFPADSDGMVAHGIVWQAALITSQVPDMRFQ